MARIRIIWRFPYAAVTATSAARYYPVDNLQNSALSQTWRSGAVNAVENVVFDFSEVVDINAVVIDNHNIAPGATIKWQTSLDGAAWVDAETIAHHAGRIIHFIGDGPLRYRYGRLNITKALATDVIEIGILRAGQYYEFDRNPAPASVKWSTDNLGETRTDKSGETTSTLGAQPRTFECAMPSAIDSMRIELQALDIACGKLIPFYMVFNADAADPYDETLYGRLASPAGFADWKGAAARRDISFSMVEEVSFAN